MKRTEFINTLEILKNDKEPQKGFSIRRTLKTLQQAKKMELVYEYIKNLKKGEEEDGWTRQEIYWNF